MTGRLSTSWRPTRPTRTRTAGQLEAGLRALAARGKPAAFTEFGCPSYRGAGAGGQGDTVIEWDDQARPVRFTPHRGGPGHDFSYTTVQPAGPVTGSYADW